jgi:hypothetical protein
MSRVRALVCGADRAAADRSQPASADRATPGPDRSRAGLAEARRELPFVFAGSAAASAGAAAAIATPPAEVGAARRLAIAGALLELAATKAMERRLGQLLGGPYRQGAAGRFTRLAKGCTEAGAELDGLGGRMRAGSAIGGGMLLAGSLFERLAVYRAGTQSAADPKYTVVPQRERAERITGKATTRPSGS